MIQNSNNCTVTRAYKHYLATLTLAEEVQQERKHTTCSCTNLGAWSMHTVHQPHGLWTHHICIWDG